MRLRYTYTRTRPPLVSGGSWTCTAVQCTSVLYAQALSISQPMLTSRPRACSQRRLACPRGGVSHAAAPEQQRVERVADHLALLRAHLSGRGERYLISDSRAPRDHCGALEAHWTRPSHTLEAIAALRAAAVPRTREGGRPDLRRTREERTTLGENVGREVPTW